MLGEKRSNMYFCEKGRLPVLTYVKNALGVIGVLLLFKRFTRHWHVYLK